MPSFFLAFIAVLLTSIGSRDQLLLARLSERLGRRLSLLVAASLISAGSALTMAWAGRSLAALMPILAKDMLVAIALLLAAAELAWPVRPEAPKEPTRSLFAISIILFLRQIGDAGRFLVFAIAVATGIPALAGIGGAMGGIAALALGWALHEQLPRALPLRLVRAALAAAVLLAGLLIGLSARGIL